MKVAINGFGRIGRLVLRNLVNQNDLEVVAINDLASPETNVHLFKYDSVHGTFQGETNLSGDVFTIGRHKAKLVSCRNVADLPWKSLGVDLVIESTGFFASKKESTPHLTAGAKKVVISAPAKEPDATFCYGINHEQYNPSKHHIVSNASCTTNCLAPLTYVLDKEYGIENGLMTTIHSYTNDQRMLDQAHEDLRRARAGALSMIPTSTGAAKAIGLVQPHLEGKIDGVAIRVPTPNVSLVDFSVNLKTSTNLKDIIKKFDSYANGSLKGVLKMNYEPLVSKDFNTTTYSSIVDVDFCKMIGDKFVKVSSWYDNEYGYSCRVVDLCRYMAKKGF